MIKIRALIVDDSVVIRRLISTILSEDPEIEVVGTAPNGRLALEKIPQINPDVITMDIEMPEMDGLKTLTEIRKIYPKLPVIIFSSLTEKGAITTLDALSLGASDYVTKPSGAGSLEQSVQRIKNDLIPKIKALCSILTYTDRILKKAQEKENRKKEQVIKEFGSKQKIDIVAIGSSTGGPNALNILIPQIPKDFPVPIVMVQHMPPVFTQLLASRLNSRSSIRIEEASDGQVLQQGNGWIAPGNYHIVLKRTGDEIRIQTNQDPPENSCRPSVDVLFKSVSEIYGANTLAVIMTGMGQDGLRGCERVHEAGGQVIAQDEASSVVWGMPGFVAKAGLADTILPLDQIAQDVIRRVMKHRV